LIGAGLSANATTADGRYPPAWQGLGTAFGEELEVDAATPIDALSTFQSMYDRPYLINRLADLLLVNEVAPGEVHQSFAQLPFDIIVTTNVDFLIEQAYREQRRPCLPLLGESQLTIQRRPEATYLLKFHGDLNHPDSLVVTEDDYDGFLQRHPVLTTFLSSVTASMTQTCGRSSHCCGNDWAG
jgi:NAD-dependent SIR2 family protein deacetylase